MLLVVLSVIRRLRLNILGGEGYISSIFQKVLWLNKSEDDALKKLCKILATEFLRTQHTNIYWACLEEEEEGHGISETY